MLGKNHLEEQCSDEVPISWECYANALTPVNWPWKCSLNRLQSERCLQTKRRNYESDASNKNIQPVLHVKKKHARTYLRYIALKKEMLGLPAYTWKHIRYCWFVDIDISNYWYERQRTWQVDILTSVSNLETKKVRLVRIMAVVWTSLCS
jgi:hypothetical protein